MKKSTKDWEWTMHRESIEYTVQSEPDPFWKYVDFYQHIHKWDFDENGNATCQSVEWVATGEYYWDGEEECEAYGARCLQCGDDVSFEGANCSAGYRKFGPGPTWVDGWFKKPADLEIACGEQFEIHNVIPELRGSVIVIKIDVKNGEVICDFMATGAIEFLNDE